MRFAALALALVLAGCASPAVSEPTPEPELREMILAADGVEIDGTVLQWSTPLEEVIAVVTEATGEEPLVRDAGTRTEYDWTGIQVWDEPNEQGAFRILFTRPLHSDSVRESPEDIVLRTADGLQAGDPLPDDAVDVNPLIWTHTTETADGLSILIYANDEDQVLAVAGPFVG